MGQFFLLTLVLLPMAAAIPIFPLGRRNRDIRDYFVIGITAAELVLALLLLTVQGSTGVLPAVCGFGLRFSATGFRTVLAIIAGFLWLMTALPSREYFANADGRNRYYVFYLLTEGALLGVFLSADLYTTFVFFEIMSFTSYVWVAQNETKEALRAAETYLAVAVIGGLTLLMGLFLLQNLLGTLEIDQLAAVAAALPREARGRLYAAGICCLVGFGAKAGVFPLHIWLPKAHPVAPAPASALLSGILTKSGIFGILVISCNLFLYDGAWGKLLLALGVITMVLGAVLAVFSVDLKRTLACSSVSQIGFILVGIGMQGLLAGENTLAVWGTVLHMMNHSLIKLVLFVTAGVVYLNTHALHLNEVRGFGNDRPWLRAIFLSGALSIAGVPLFSGYVSKTLLHESIVEYIHLLEAQGLSGGVYRAVEWLFLFAGGLTVAYMTKLFVAIFIDPKVPGHHVPPDPYMDTPTRWALTVGASLLVLLGLSPASTMQPIAEFSQSFLHGEGLDHALHYFSWANLQGVGISLLIGGLVYFGFIRTVLMTKDRNGMPLYLDRLPKRLDLEESVYRPALQGLAFAGAFVSRVVASVGDVVLLGCRNILFLKAPGIIVPKGNDAFGVYGNDPERYPVTETFAFDLLVAGVGLVATLGYILLR
ncbi:MAG: proton-conducting transporter membrane subunit [Oscillospiraceae bacterium]